MTLPGKLCIGILEEDNPLRSYFRFKPLLIDENGRYIPFDEWDHYPDEGCIRIVPDKNESYYFKARMRQNGLFCVVDLREHPGESDKIRPNKNYHPGGDEVNGCIVYSDVVRGPAPNMIYQVLPAESAGAIVPIPHTETVLLRQGDALMPVLHTWEALEATAGMALMKATEESCPVQALQTFDLPGFRGENISFAIRPASTMAAVSDMPERPPLRHAAPADEAVQKPGLPEKHDPRTAADAKKAPAAPKDAHRQEPAESKPAEPPKAPEAPKAAEAQKAPEAPPTPEAPRVPAASAEVGKDAGDLEKPWLHHDASMLPPPIDRRLSRAEQLMAAQAGLNPRRGRSLQELIDEKWTHSRLNQLGMPVSPIATGAPVANPVDAAVDTLQRLWDQPQMRKPLMEALARSGSLGEAVTVQREAAQQANVNAQLNELEAQRLELLGELERLKAGNQQMREKLKQEILKDDGDALAESAARVRAAQAELQKYEQQARDARDASRDAQALLDTLAGDQLEQKIRDVALTRRVAERLEALKAASEGHTVPPQAEAVDMPAFIRRFEARAKAEGWNLDAFEIANLCVCLALSPVMTLSGPTGSGKTTAAKLLADALGVTDAHRLAVCAPDKGSLRQDARIAELIKHPETPAVLVLDDANLAPNPDPLRGMNPLPGPEWRIIATLQDGHSGLPVTAALLDRGFMVRLSVPEDLPWQPAARHAASAFPLASIAGLADALPQAEMSEVFDNRMELLRHEFKIFGVIPSRHALDDTWRYCAAMLALVGEEYADRIYDHAVSQRILPPVLASAPIKSLVNLRNLLGGLPRCQALFDEPVSISI